MPTLAPNQAAEIANGVYKIQLQNVTQIYRDNPGLQLGFESLFAVGDESRVTGTSGLLKWRPLTGFGFVAVGIGQFKDEALIALRGTDAMQDWLTDGNASSVGGVHTGFATTWGTIKPQVDQFFRSYSGKKFKTIHCIGHSLGGALATLAALHCAESGYGAPELYTFGSPRVGLRAVAERITSAIGASRIHRVAHVADPVPMIPRMPFVHVPTTTEAFIIGPGSVLPINVSAHSMASSYLKEVGGLASWSGLTRVNPAASQRNIEQWIAQLASGQIQPQQLNERDLYMLGQSIDYAAGVIGRAPAEVAGLHFYGLTSGLDFLSESEQRYERAKLQAAQRMAQTTSQAAQKVGQAASRTAVHVGRTMIEAERIEREMEEERNRQIAAAAKAIYVYTRQQAQWAKHEAKKGARAAIDTHAKAMDLLDQQIYQPIARMASQAVTAASR